MASGLIYMSVYLVFTVLGGFVGWQAKAAAVEEAEFEREAQRDAEWDRQHLGGCRG